MENTTFGTKERSLLLGLMTLGGAASNPELRDRVGNALDGAARRKLNDHGLVKSEKPGRAFHHKLTDEGWAWCAEELTNTAPAHGGSFGRTLYALLSVLDRFLDAKNLGLGEFIDQALKSSAAPPPETVDADTTDGALKQAAQTASTQAEAVSSEPSTTAASPAEASVADASAAVANTTSGAAAGLAAAAFGATEVDGAGVDVAALVRNAYWRLAQEPQEWVMLTRLRPLLGNVPRNDVDEALRRMERMPDVHLVPEADQKTLTGEDRAAAVLVGGVGKHLLAIEAS